ncbi:MAG: caspase family protein [Armatimonadetes bacterium]|nr:caspase family protein [Armatimonadota bacterium]
MRRLWVLPLFIALVPALGLGQSWRTAYEAGLADARSGSWEKARESFKQAAAYRAEDVSGPTVLPGPATERQRWRNGAPYSPNFLAAYCSYRIGQASVAQDAKIKSLNTSADELNTLLAKNQVSYEAVYFLSQIYTQLGNMQKRTELDQRLQSAGTLSWKVDTEPVAPEDLAVVAQMSGKAAPGGTDVRTTNPGAGTPPVQPGVTIPSGPMTRVPTVLNKFALLIGNTESRLEGAKIPFASEDSMLVRESLVTSAGYAESNVDMVQNATAGQMMAAAKALAERIPDGATVFIFVAGPGVNINGKDYLAGVDTELATDTRSMVAKSDLYAPFIAKGARVFAFFEANRPVVAGRYFGMEVPMFGSISQTQGTIPGEQVHSQVFNGRTVGVFANALSAVIGDFRSNRIPIHEFGWQVFYKIRKGDTGDVPGASRQTPTLPVLTNLAADARF